MSFAKHFIVWLQMVGRLRGHPWFGARKVGTEGAVLSELHGGWWWSYFLPVSSTVPAPWKVGTGLVPVAPDAEPSDTCECPASVPTRQSEPDSP